MKYTWFKRKGIFILPLTFVGWIITGLAIFYAVYVFLDIDSRSHSVSNTLMSWVLNVLVVGVIYYVIGYIFSKKQDIRKIE